MAKVDGVSEYELSLAALEYLSGRPGGSASIEELVANLPSHVALTDSDLSASQTRPQEAIWEQRVRNIVSHKDSATNFVKLGYLTAGGGVLTITEAGRDYLKRELG